MARILRCRDQSRWPVPDQTIQSVSVKHPRHFDPSDVELREAWQISALIEDLDRVVQILDCDIATEEERAGVFKPSHRFYPVVARSLAERRKNLKRTVAALEKRLASRPGEAELVRLMRMPNNT
jgi:hypothetical protein